MLLETVIFSYYMDDILIFRKNYRATVSRCPDFRQSLSFNSFITIFNLYYFYLAPFTVNLLGSVHLVSTDFHKVAFALLSFLMVRTFLAAL